MLKDREQPEHIGWQHVMKILGSIWLLESPHPFSGCAEYPGMGQQSREDSPSAEQPAPDEATTDRGFQDSRAPSMRGRQSEAQARYLHLTIALERS